MSGDELVFEFADHHGDLTRLRITRDQAERLCRGELPDIVWTPEHPDEVAADDETSWLIEYHDARDVRPDDEEDHPR